MSDTPRTDALCRKHLNSPNFYAADALRNFRLYGEALERELAAEHAYAEQMRRMVEALLACADDPQANAYDGATTRATARALLAKNPNPSGLAAAAGQAAQRVNEDACGTDLAPSGPVGLGPAVVRLDDKGQLDEVVGADALMENLDVGHWFIEIGDVAVWLYSKGKITASYERRERPVVSACVEESVEVPSHDTIAAMLPSLLVSSCCPLCGRDGFHQHSAEEIVIYRNGVKYGRRLCSAPWANEAPKRERL